MHFRRIVLTQDGVYQPRALVPRLVLYGFGFLVLAGAALAGRLTLTTAALYFALLGVPFSWSMYIYLKWGKLGQPSVSIAAGELVMDRPQRAHGEVRFALADLKHVLVHGFQGRRAYRFECADGRVEEVVPLWGRHVEAAVIEFLRERLPADVVTIEEPQKLFGSLRGDRA